MDTPLRHRRLKIDDRAPAASGPCLPRFYRCAVRHAVPMWKFSSAQGTSRPRRMSILRTVAIVSQLSLARGHRRASCGDDPVQITIRSISWTLTVSAVRP